MQWSPSVWRVPLRRLCGGVVTVDEVSALCSICGFPSRNQIAQRLGLHREQRFGAGAGVPDERVMDDIVIGQPGVAGEVLQGRPRVGQPRERDRVPEVLIRVLCGHGKEPTTSKVSRTRSLPIPPITRAPHPSTISTLPTARKVSYASEVSK